MRYALRSGSHLKEVRRALAGAG